MRSHRIYARSHSFAGRTEDGLKFSKLLQEMKEEINAKIDGLQRSVDEGQVADGQPSALQARGLR